MKTPSWATEGASRRDWLRGAAATALAGVLRPLRANGWGDSDGEHTAIRAASVRAEEAGLGALRVVETENYVCAGNAPERFCKTALSLCEGLARDFLEHFRAREFAVERPKRRLMVVVLADDRALGAFLGQAPDPEVRGVYDLESDWLVVCDNRGEGGPRAERANSVALFHEATHQLTFHTGLMDRASDVPLAISEGLGTYGETRRPDGRTRVGARNAERLAVLAAAAHAGDRLFPAAKLIGADELLNGAETQQAAYAQSWLLVHMLMRPGEDAGRFRAYLDALRPRRDAVHRRDDVRAHLGEFTELDEALKRYANKLLAR